MSQTMPTTQATAPVAGTAMSAADTRRRAAMLRERLTAIMGRLESEATSRVSKRRSLEQRWIEDLEQYHGRYDDKTRRALENGSKSKLFINMTRPKTSAMSARLMDLLFPTDDKNWGIQPTPVPELTRAAKAAMDAAKQMREQAKAAQEAAMAGAAAPGAAPGAMPPAAPDMPPMPAGPMAPPVDPMKAQADALMARAEAATQAADEIQAMVEEGRKRADLMAEEIDDQLKESLYHAVARDMIEDACKFGTGVCKGPVTGSVIRKGWKQQQAANENGEPTLGPDGQPSMEYKLQMSAGNHPAMRYVDLWSFFPDMDVRSIEDSQGVFERHLMNKKRVRQLAQLPGFDKEALRRLLSSQPRATAPTYMAELRSITGDSTQVTNDIYHVWEYSGPLSAEDMRDIAEAMGDTDTVADLAEIDPLEESNAIVWFCQGEVLKFALYPYDSGECMYSVFNLEKDESSIFGYGIPSIMRDPQRAMNASWRAMMDNAGLTSGPQIVIATDLIEPADGDWELSPRKVWKAKAGIPQDRRAFDAFNIPTQQVEMANIIALSKQFIDDMTAMPQVAQGEQGAGVTKTAQGMALLMNSANVVFRRIVKNFDDDVTTPNIRRFYDWNMQFSDKEEIKGDYSVDARGSSVLLVRELQSQNLMFIATQLGAHPVFGAMLKNRGVLRKLFQAMMIPTDEVMMSDDEIDEVLAAAAAQAEAAQQAALAAATPAPEAADTGPADLKTAELEFKREELDAKIQLANMDADMKLKLATLARDTAMMQMAEKLNMSLDQIEGKLMVQREAAASKENMLAAEAAMAVRTGQSGGGYV